MKFFRLDLLTLLISLFILSGCKSQTGIGLDPDQKLEGSLYVDTNIKVFTLPEDSVVTSLPTSTAPLKMPLAYINDPQIGVTTSDVVASVGLPSGVAYTLPAGDITVDSAVLVMRYADGFYGDSLTTKYKADVYQLTNDRPRSSRSYYNTHSWSHEATAIGTRTFNARPKTRFKITDIVTGKADTLKQVAAQVRIPLSKSFISSNFFGASSAALASNNVFQDSFKGLYLTLDKAQINGVGGNMMFTMDSSRVDVYYRANSNGTIDTAVVSLPFTAYAASIKHTYTAAVQTSMDTTKSANTFYIQGLAGLKAKVRFPDLKSIITQIGSDIIINRAELVITPLPGTTVPLTAIPKISMYQWDLAHQRAPLQDSYAGDKRYQGASVFGGYYSTLNDYHFIVTGYIQDLMRGKTVDYGTYISAVDTTNKQTVDYAPTAQTAGRLVAVGTVGKTSTNQPYRIKLNIIYTKIGSVK